MAEREYLITYKPDLAFVAYIEDDEVDNFDPVEYFLDGMHTWVMETNPLDIAGNVRMERV